MRNKIARPYLVDSTVKVVGSTDSVLLFAVVRLSWMAVGPIGAELTGSRTSAVCWGRTLTRSWKFPMVSWAVRSGTSTTLALSRTSTACRDRFWMDTGTSPEEPPIGTCGATMIVIRLSSPLMNANSLPARPRPWAVRRPRQATDSVAVWASSSACT